MTVDGLSARASESESERASGHRCVRGRCERRRDTRGGGAAAATARRERLGVASPYRKGRAQGRAAFERAPRGRPTKSDHGRKTAISKASTFRKNTMRSSKGEHPDPQQLTKPCEFSPVCEFTV